jgi:hypothetical protein
VSELWSRSSASTDQLLAQPVTGASRQSSGIAALREPPAGYRLADRLIDLRRDEQDAADASTDRADSQGGRPAVINVCYRTDCTGDRARL